MGGREASNAPSLTIKLPRNIACVKSCSQSLQRGPSAFHQDFKPTEKAASLNCELGAAAGEPYHSVKLEAVLEAPIEHVLALAVEYDLTKMWNSFMKESAILHAE